MKETIKLVYSKETKNTFVFKEVNEGAELIVPSLYINRDAFYEEKRPEEIKLTIESK